MRPICSAVRAAHHILSPKRKRIYGESVGFVCLRKLPLLTSPIPVAIIWWAGTEAGSGKDMVSTLRWLSVPTVISSCTHSSSQARQSFSVQFRLQKRRGDALTAPFFTLDFVQMNDPGFDYNSGKFSNQRNLLLYSRTSSIKQLISSLKH